MNLDFSFVLHKFPVLLEGCWVTLEISSLSLLLGLVFGIAGALCRLSSRRLLTAVAFLYVWVIRGTSVLVQLFILYFALPQVGIRMSSMTAGVLGLAVNTGAYITEVIRAGVQAVDKGQMEAALSLGMKPRQAMRRIIGPQAIKICIPPLVNQFILNLKNSSIASLVTITELFRTGEQIIHASFRSLEVYTVVAGLYLAMNSIFMVIDDRLEKGMARQSSYILEMHNVCKSFGSVPVLGNFNLKVCNREKVVIIGPSGSGKSTVLRCINQLEAIQSGNVIFDGQEITKVDLSLVRMQIGMVFQRFNLFPHKTALENVIEAPIIVKRMPKDEAQKLGRALLERVGLSDKCDSYPKELSGGQQRVWR